MLLPVRNGLRKLSFGCGFVWISPKQLQFIGVRIRCWALRYAVCMTREVIAHYSSCMMSIWLHGGTGGAASPCELQL